jgi:hypothetical protein
MRALLLAAALVLLTVPAMAYTGTRSALAPGGADVFPFGPTGAAACQRAVNLAAAHCGFFGAGGTVFADIGCPGPVGCLPLASNFAVGTCTVGLATPPFSGDFEFVCAADRDDDGVITGLVPQPQAQLAWGSALLPDAGSSDPDGFDDDVAVGRYCGVGGCDAVVAPPANTAAVPICFRRDRTLTSSVTDPVPGGDWDEFEVYVMFNIPSTSMAAGVATVTLTAAGAAGCPGATPVSGHTHGLWFA